MTQNNKDLLVLLFGGLCHLVPVGSMEHSAEYRSKPIAIKYHIRAGIVTHCNTTEKTMTQLKSVHCYLQIAAVH